MKIRPKEFFNPISSKNWINGYITAWKGISMAATKHMNTIVEAFPLFLTIIHAARLLTRTIRSTENAVIRAVVKTALKKWICEIDVRIYCIERVVGKDKGFEIISSCPLNEFTKRIQRGAKV
jgi:hypothetical protein